MSTGGVFLFVAFFLAVVAIIALPLLKTGRIAVALDASIIPAELNALRQSILASLRDLDFDFQTGKLSEEDYRVQRELLLQQGTSVLRQLDAYQDNPAQNKG